MTSLTTIIAVFSAGALFCACSKPSPAPVGPDSAVSVPSASEASAPATAVPAASAPSASAAAPASKAPETASYDENTKAITAKAGSRFSLLLPANVSTPMKWRIQPAPDTAILIVAGERYAETPPANCAGCTGYPGTKRFDFDAHGAGKQTLHLSYGSLTDPKAKPEKVLTIDVTVE